MEDAKDVQKHRTISINYTVSCSSIFLAFLPLRELNFQDADSALGRSGTNLKMEGKTPLSFDHIYFWCH